MGNVVRVVALVAAVACLLTALSVQTTVERSGGRQARSTTVGLGSSPVYQKLVEEETGRLIRATTVTTLWSWSAALAVTGLVLLGFGLRPGAVRPRREERVP